MTPYHMLLDCCNGLWHLTSVVFALSDKAQTWNHNMLGSEDKGRNLAKLMEVDITEQCLGQTWGMQESCNRGATALNRGIVSASCDSRDHSRTDERATIGLDFMHFVVGVVSTWSGLSPLTWSMSKQYFDLPRSVFFSPWFVLQSFSQSLAVRLAFETIESELRCALAKAAAAAARQRGVGRGSAAAGTALAAYAQTATLSCRL